ncbi:MAG: hypothetical protein KY469_10640 [Actinobacteria bacterium]|nr:hypothetical protein [Actinomycetota bacterium]
MPIMTVTSVSDDRVELRDGATGCAPLVPHDHGLKVGDVVEATFTHGSLGEIVRIVHDGRTVLYRDEITRAHRHALGVARDKVAKLERFEDARAGLEAQVDALPEVFQRRIDKFVGTKGPSWWWEFADYELVCCTDAVKAARHVGAMLGLEPGLGIDSDDLVQQVREAIGDLGPSDVEGADEGHSGNTWGFATRLAYWWLTQPDMVTLEHGALTPLVGCEEYGCPHETVPSGDYGATGD